MQVDSWSYLNLPFQCQIQKTLVDIDNICLTPSMTVSTLVRLSTSPSLGNMTKHTRELRIAERQSRHPDPSLTSPLNDPRNMRPCLQERLLPALYWKKPAGYGFCLL